MKTWKFHPSSDILGFSHQEYVCNCVCDYRQFIVCVCVLYMGLCMDSEVCDESDDADLWVTE